MRIQEVCTETGLTKKAISWYEQQGLIKIRTDENGYRDFSANDVAVLREIDLLRKLALSAKEIKVVLKSNDKAATLRNLRPKKVLELNQAKQRLDVLDKLVANYSAGTIQELSAQTEMGSIAEKLQHAFPGVYGEIMLNHFLPYLRSPIQSAEEVQAYMDILAWLDNTNVKVPFLVRILQKYMAKLNVSQIQNPDEGINKMLNAGPEEREAFKQMMLQEAQARSKWYVKWNPLIRSNQKLRKRLEQAGYYDTFIANMKRLSPSYAAYSNRLVAFDEKLRNELGLSYDAKGNIQIS